MIIVSFLGYVLVWGQMSYWAATVITNLVSAVPYFGFSLVEWLWGDFSVGDSTLGRFYTFHFLFPFVVMVLAFVHLMFLHVSGSRNPLGVDSGIDRVKFHPYFTSKDAFGFVLL